MYIKVNNLFHRYDDDAPWVLEDISFSIGEGEFLGLVGHTGSGKSTLVQMLNGLLKPDRGTVTFAGKNIHQEKGMLKEVRQKVGLVFQYPEHQLFEETVYEDVAFGPRNLGLDKEEVDKRVYRALSLVGLGEDFMHRSPFRLSGGQKRMAAIAGVLAMEPEVLILDEPSAGLDPEGRYQILQKVKNLHDEEGISVVLISHRMEEIASMVERMLVMNKGRLVLEGSPGEVFQEKESLREIGLDVPQMAELMWRLAEEGLAVRTNIFTLEEAEGELLRVFSRGGVDHV
ncbi:MAG: energy-coupling factor transporter ATPase [Halanaerobium sp.]|nr:energy-coupling factor transporter ATPase [Halanaerobium sp.]